MIDWRQRAVSAAQVAGYVGSGQRVFVHGAAATPTPLMEALCLREDLQGVRLYHLHTDGPAPWVAPELAGRFTSMSLFTGAHCRTAVAEGRADFIPVFLGDIPDLFRNRVIPLDVAILQVSPPDKHGYCSVGTSVNASVAAARSADIVLAEINERMPRTHGATVIPVADITAFVYTDRPLPAHKPRKSGPVEAAIGELIADLVEDEATLQMGIGAIPDAVLARLFGKRDLGVHTEMFSDGVIDLFEAGVVTNACKKVHAGRIVTSFVIGSQRLYDFVDDNPLVEFHPCDRTNNTHLICKNDKVVAINSALEIDLSGQVCADSMGHRIYSGIGGQMDFVRGAALSRGGKPIIALPSTAAGGTVSRISATLKPGAGVVTTRGHVHWIVTEYGAVNLHGLSLRERGDALIHIAHPDFRAQLRREFQALRHFPISA